MHAADDELPPPSPSHAHGRRRGAAGRLSNGHPTKHASYDASGRRARPRLSSAHGQHSNTTTTAPPPPPPPRLLPLLLPLLPPPPSGRSRRLPVVPAPAVVSVVASPYSHSDLPFPPN
ncbi:hypothetical protein ACJQWK_10961 [Exserohilum turcicum]